MALNFRAPIKASQRSEDPHVATKKLRQSGNTLSLNLDKAIREAAGFMEGQELRIEASEGRLVVTAADDKDYSDAMAAYEESLRRYKPVYDALAK